MEKLSPNQLCEIRGGVNRKEYCAQVSQLIVDNWDQWTDDQKRAAANAYLKHC